MPPFIDTICHSDAGSPIAFVFRTHRDEAETTTLVLALLTGVQPTRSIKLSIDTIDGHRPIELLVSDDGPKIKVANQPPSSRGDDYGGASVHEVTHLVVGRDNLFARWEVLQKKLPRPLVTEAESASHYICPLAYMKSGGHNGIVINGGTTCYFPRQPNVD